MVLQFEFVTVTRSARTVISSVVVLAFSLEKGVSTPASASIDAYGYFINLLRSYTKLITSHGSAKVAI
jgi:hypothetical protein